MKFSAEEIRIHKILLSRARKISDPLAEAIENVGPVTSKRQGRSSISHFLARAVIGQQLSAAAARSIWKRVIAAANDTNMSVLDFVQQHGDDVRSCGVSGNKLRALRSIGDAERNGILCEKKLRKVKPEERVETLLEIHGVGPWTCDMALIFYYYLPDIWPEGDAAVQRTFSRLIGRRKTNVTAAVFSPYRSFLALMMWRLADAEF